MTLDEIILIKDGEIALKGLNRSTFEDKMIKNIRWRISDLGEFRFERSQSTVNIVPVNGADIAAAAERMKYVFGIAAFSRAAVAEKDIEDIKRVAGEYLEDELYGVKTFKVEAKRSDKRFPLTSPEISREVGGYLLGKFRHLSVDVHEPDTVITVEVREQHVYIRGSQIRGAGGLPVGSAGRAALMISGGIDSPVAGWMMAKRGVQLNAIHFASPPYTSTKAELKVHELLRAVSKYSGKIYLKVVPFTEIQEAIKDNCPEDLFTLIMRRMMMRIASRLATEDGCSALITGESLGQVASQTMQALACTNAVSPIPVFRPLIGMDKNEIIGISRKIGTFDTSILPYEDCCTVFTPKHPKTRPTVDILEEAEKLVEWDEMLERAVNGVKNLVIY